MSPPDGSRGGEAQAPAALGSAVQPSGRVDRPPVLAFAADADTEEALRKGLGDSVPAQAVRRADITQAIAALRRTPTPLSLIIDVAGHDQPIAALEDLAQVVEPDVRVMVVGDRQDLGFYRHLTQRLGVLDYLFKPITPAVVAQLFAPLVAPPSGGAAAGARAGRIIAVTGARGGVGATSVAVNLAWHLAETAQRHTALLDADLHTGTAALLLGVEPGQGLRAALETPARIDELFVERAGTRAGPRLHVLAAEEPLRETPGYAADAAKPLLAALQRRCNYIVIDLPLRPSPLHRDLAALAHQRVIVLEPSLASVRDTLRLLALPPGLTPQLRRPVLVLNRVGRRGGLGVEEVGAALHQAPDVLIREQSRRLETAATMGRPAAGQGGDFAAAMARLAEEAGAMRAVEPGRRGGLLALFRRRA